MKHETITAEAAQIAFADLYVSDLNPRTVFSAEGIEALAANIREHGLIQNLAGLRDDAGKIGIVAGGRRLRALETLQDDPRFHHVAVKIAPDLETAQVWASSENHQREQPHPADEIREYGAMAARGVAIASIAIAFGVDDKHVQRRLKLAGLPAPVLDDEGEAELAALQAALDGAYSADQKAVAGVLYYVDQRGAVQRQEGLVSREDRAAAIEAGFLRASQHEADAGPKSAISQKLRDDLGRVAKGARQHAILRDPDLLLDLLAYQLSHSLAWQSPLGVSLSEVPNWPSTEGEGYALDERLTPSNRPDMYGKDLAKSFRAFRKKGRDHMRAELARFLAGQYRGGSAELSAMIDKETAPSIREVWTPTAPNFFSRVGGPYLNDLWCELLDLAASDATATSFAKLKKGEKADKLEALFRGDEDLRAALAVTAEQAAKIAAWLPEGME